LGGVSPPLNRNPRLRTTQMLAGAYHVHMQTTSICVPGTQQQQCSFSATRWSLPACWGLCNSMTCEWQQLCWGAERQVWLMQHLINSGDLLSVPSGGSIPHGACIVVVARRKRAGRSGSALGPRALVNERQVQRLRRRRCLRRLESSGDLLKVLSSGCTLIRVCSIVLVRLERTGWLRQGHWLCMQLDAAAGRLCRADWCPSCCLDGWGVAASPGGHSKWWGFCRRSAMRRLRCTPQAGASGDSLSVP
jgi:hypothetical protein